MAIEFSSLPDSIRKPGTYTEEDTSAALRGVAATPQKVLLIGQRTSSGTVLAHTPTRIYDTSSPNTYFGPGSMLARMCIAALTANPTCHLTAMAVDDADASVAASGDIDFTGTATATGILYVAIGPDSIPVEITLGDAAAAVATKVVAALTNAKQPGLPVTAAVDGVDDTQVNFTAKNKGTMGNDIELTCDVEGVPGITVVVTGFASGATDPTLTTALSVIYGTQYHFIVCGINAATQLQAIRDHLEDLAGPLEQRPGLGVYGFRGTLGNATTLAGTSLNSGRMSGALLRESTSLASEIGSAYAVVIAGEEDPAAPLDGAELPGLVAPLITDRLSRSEQETCLLNGVTPCEVGSGERVRIVRAISTYVTNGAGTPDATLLDITTLRTLDDFRAQWKARMESVFGSGSPAGNRKIIARNLQKIKVETLSVMYSLEELERLRNVDDYKDQVEVEESSTTTGRVNVSIPAPVVPGLHILAAKFNLVL